VNKIGQLIWLNFSFICFAWSQTITFELPLVASIHGKLSPKSIVHNGNGLFFAQNMMYRHTVNVYNRDFELVKIIKDEIELKKYGYDSFKGKYKGAPVECAFSHQGKYAWVSNYLMTGGDSTEFVKPGCDQCSARNIYDSSFVYKINTSTFEIESVIKVGAVPKYLQVTPDNKKVLVTNWSSADLSIIDIAENKEVKRIKIGTYPRGIAIDSKSKFAYFAIMGGNTIARLDLNTYELNYLKNVGKSPRHLCISPDDQYLYASFNGEGAIGKINLTTEEITKVKSGNQPRSMVLSDDGESLFVVNYGEDNFAKLNTKSMEVIAKTPTKHHPIGITYDAESHHVWVACYTGYLQVFSNDTIAPTSNIAQTNTPSSPTRKSVPNESIAKKETTAAPSPPSPKKVVAQSYTHATPKSVMKPVQVEDKQPYYVIGGAFSNVLNAQKQVEKFQQNGFSSFTHANKQKGYTYCVVQACATMDEANELMKQLKSEGTSSWVLKTL
jgi:YVTN family beta-propeller protein